MKFNIKKPLNKKEIEQYSNSKNKLLLILFSLSILVFLVIAVLHYNFNTPENYLYTLAFFNILALFKIVQVFDSLADVSEEEAENILFYAENNPEVEAYLIKVNKIKRTIIKSEYEAIRTIFYNKIHNLKKEALYNY